MKTRLAIAVLAFGVAVGAVAGRVRYERLDDERPLCASCHHGASDLLASGVTPPHRTDFRAGCHGCHVLPVKQYLEHSAQALFLGQPEWIAKVTNPVVGGQTCLECHIAHGRGIVTCERCHADGTTNVEIVDRCEACHDDHRLAPHDTSACRDCHIEVYLDPEGRAHRWSAHDEDP